MILLSINLVFAASFILGAVFFWRRTAKLKSVDSKINWEPVNDYVLVSVSVPKNNDRTPQAAEQMFASLHGIFRPGAETQPKISFEIVSKDRAIMFYIHMPRELKDFVISQIYAQYPTVEVAEIAPANDYTNLTGTQPVVATELSLKKPTVYSIKTFQNFEVDPLAAITGVLSSVAQDEQVWIQMIIRPADDDWQNQGETEVKNIKEPPKSAKGFGELIVEELKRLGMDLIRSAPAGIGQAQAPEEKKKDDKPTDLSGPVKQAITGIEEKVTKLGFETKIRLLASAGTLPFAQAKLEQTIGAFKQFNTLNMNSFVTDQLVTDASVVKLFQNRELGDNPVIFNITELASLYHYPSETVATPTIAWAGSKKGEPPGNLPIIGSVPADELTVFAQTNYRNEVRKFGLKKKDRRLHLYVIGKTGTGKSTLLENMAIDDIHEGRGLAVVDPHGELIQHILASIPEDRMQDVVYFNPADVEFPIGFNLLENVDPEQKNIVASGVVGIMEKIFGEVSWGPRLEYILRNVILALLEYPGSTFLGIMRILTDSAYRRLVLNEVKDPVIRDFFMNEYEKYDPKFRTEAIAPIQNKVGQFLSASTVRNIIGQPKSTIDINEIMDNGKILLVDLSIGKIGEDNSALLGSMIITKIQLAAMKRVHIPEEQRRDFYLYVDEFQNFATDSFATILSEARKYRLALTMANQYVNQMPETVANAVFGNVGTMVSFRVGAQDANVLEKEFEPVFDANDLVNLDNHQIYLKMSIDGVTARPFSAGTLPPRAEKYGLEQQIIESSRKLFTRPLADVEDYITEWSEPINLSDMADKGGRAETRTLAGDGETRNDNRREEGVLRSTNAPHQQIVTLPQQTTPSPIPTSSETSAEPVRSQPKPEPEFTKTTSPQLQTNAKVEVLKDRFDRPWYAVVADTISTVLGQTPPPEPVQRSTEVAAPVPTMPAIQPPPPLPKTVSEPSVTSTHQPEVGESPVNKIADIELPIAQEQVEAASEQGTIVQDTHSAPEQGIGEERSDDLISWDDAEKLGIRPDETGSQAQMQPTESDDLIPLNEL